MKPFLYDGVYIKNPSKELLSAFTFTIVDYKGRYSTVKLYSKDGGLYKFPYGAIDYIEDYEDKTVAKKLSASLVNNIQLREDQEKVLNSIKEPKGILFSAPGSGKTVMGCELIHRTGLATLILVPTVYLLEQWKERVKTFLGYDAGVLGGGSSEIKEITISTFPSALNNLKALKEQFGLLLVDETHRIAADTYRGVVDEIPAKYKFGMTGTLERKDKLDFMIPAYLSKTIIKNEFNPSLTPSIVVVKVPIRLLGKNYVEALNFISNNESVLKIQAKWLSDLYYKRYQLGLSLRKSHLDNLKDRLTDYKVKLITGSSNKKERDNLNEEVKESRIILSTNVLDEGADITNLDCLHLLTPTNNIPKLIQRLNRVTRYKEDKKVPLIFDYWFDGNMGKWSVLKQQRVRLAFYKEKGFKIYAR